MAYNIVQSEIEIVLDYKPADFFEEKIAWTSEDYSIEIEGGHIITRMTAGFFDTHPDFIDFLKKELNSYFVGAQLYEQKHFEFMDWGINRKFPDGRRSISRFLPLTLEVLPRDDRPRRERIESMKKLSQLSARFSLVNPTVHRMLESFKASVRDRENEFVHLYEIWEALKTKFRSGKKAVKALGISQTDRSKLTNLANNKHLIQGRHRGQQGGGLRNATPDELSEARRIAQEMVEKYLKYLDRHDE